MQHRNIITNGKLVEIYKYFAGITEYYKTVTRKTGKHFEKCFGDISTRFIYYTSEEIKY